MLQVLYSIFTQGYAAGSGPDLQRPDVAEEAIRLARILRRLLPAERKVAGLLGLMLLIHARREARTGPDGELVPSAPRHLPAPLGPARAITDPAGSRSEQPCNARLFPYRLPRPAVSGAGLPLAPPSGRPASSKLRLET